jgi:hypothetical protein
MRLCLHDRVRFKIKDSDEIFYGRIIQIFNAPSGLESEKKMAIKEEDYGEVIYKTAKDVSK